MPTKIPKSAKDTPIPASGRPIASAAVSTRARRSPSAARVWTPIGPGATLPPGPAPLTTRVVGAGSTSRGDLPDHALDQVVHLFEGDVRLRKGGPGGHDDLAVVVLDRPGVDDERTGG